MTKEQCERLWKEQAEYKAPCAQLAESTCTSQEICAQVADYERQINQLQSNSQNGNATGTPPP